MANLKKRDKTERQLYIGFFTGSVKSVNPNKAELEELLGNSLPDDMEEISYESKDKDGNEVVSLSFWIQADTPEKQWFNARFRITDKVQKNKDDSKTQYVSQSAGTSWADNKNNLLDWFTHYQRETSKGSKVYENVADKEVREALQGEGNLYEFLRAWYAKVDWYSPDTNVLIDTKKAFRNIDKYVNDEFRPLLKLTGDDVLTGPVVALATVYTGEKDGNVVHYQNLYSGGFLGGYMMKKISYAMSSNNWTDKGIKKYHEQLTGAHGPKEAFELCMLKPFDPENFIQATNDTLRVDTSEPTDASY